ncbi:endolytic transglycosylase MltG [Sphingomonas sp. 1P06PA]|uniref:endolytic transglycosylase MltG n=1 Tax=Sphingomonas sp. 1P06PA TaxID=554121 RepID=UPI0039A5B32D
MAGRARRRSRTRPILLILLLAAAGGAWFYVSNGWTGAGPADRAVAVSIPEGATLTAAARVLEREGAIRSARDFLRNAKLFGGSAAIKAGEYEFPARASAREILSLLQAGRTLQRMVTIPEGMPAVLVHEKLTAEPLLTGKVVVPAEGSVLPDSYSFERGEQRAAVLKRMQAAMTKTVDTLWASRKPSTAVVNKRDAVILASIVEKETGIPSERRTVAAVYSNRLRMGMRLQADPTTIYPITKGRPLGRRIRRSELDAVNAYNTYAKAGLPAGPIANPGRESIAAVLDPAPSKAIYFVADGTGGHVFAETLAQHNANVAKWRALRAARGE